MNRFFRTSPEIYTQVRAGLDTAFGHPKVAVADDGTEVFTSSCLAPVESLSENGEGRICCAVLAQDCEMPEVAPVLDAMIGQGLIEEVSESVFFSATGTAGV